MFDGMLTQPQPDEDEQPGLETKKCRMSVTPLLAEMKEFRDSRVPMRDSVSFWKVSGLTRLKVCA